MGFLRDPKTAQKYGTLRQGVCDRAAARTAQLWSMGIISGASRHPMVEDVRFRR